MNVSGYKIVRLAPPGDTFLLVELETDAGISGWGEITGSGSDRGTVAFIEEAMPGILGRDATDIDAAMAGFRRFRLPPLRDRCAVTAWSGINQALWDLAARNRGVPLCDLLGGGSALPRTVPLYANLNRGLFGDRSPAAFARHAEGAKTAGFAFVKATPFDEITPASTDTADLAAAFARLGAVYAAVDTEHVAVDCHWRFNPGLARAFMDWQQAAGRLHWIEDLLDTDLPDRDVAGFRGDYPGTTWAGGEDSTHPAMAARLLDGPARPDVFMPDVKHLCGLDVLQGVLLSARARGCGLSLHNPSGPVATAVSAHLWAAVSADEPLEFCFRAVETRASLTAPVEPVEDGAYVIGEGPGIGVAPAPEALQEFGTVLARGTAP